MPECDAFFGRNGDEEVLPVQDVQSLVADLLGDTKNCRVCVPCIVSGFLEYVSTITAAVEPLDGPSLSEKQAIDHESDLDRKSHQEVARRGHFHPD